MGTLEYSMRSIYNFVGRDMGTTDWVQIGQDRIDAFAECTGDRQWIHVDAARARRESPFGTTIAHGYLTLSLVAPMVAQAGLVPADAKAALNYGIDRVRFITPVKAGARVRGRLAILSAEPQGAGRILLKASCALDIEGEPKPALVAEILCMLAS
jgi:acyl dehydratase